jgi:deoxyhypusine synthase
MTSKQAGSLCQFMEEHYRHFNAAALMDAAKGYKKHINEGGKMLVTLGGAMSTAELGRSLAEMIRQGKVQAISCTGANLEEDVFNLVAHNHYARVPHWRNLTPDDEMKLFEQGMNRVTDTCIPEDEAMRKIERVMNKYWKESDEKGETLPPYKFFWKVIEDPEVVREFQIPPENSWLLAAKEMNIPIFTPGWEDSTLGNMYTAANMDGRIKNVQTVEHGIQTMMRLAKWYQETATEKSKIGFFQIGGGIAGDFPICVVPMLHQDLELNDCPLWGYFCQISDSTTSYGSYSGATPSEKITWGKLGVDTPQFVIESDATIVAPLLFGYVLGW